MALDTPIPQIELALDGKVDFVRKTNPFGGEDDNKRDDGKTLKARDKPPTAKERAEVAKTLKAMLGRKKAG